VISYAAAREAAEKIAADICDRRGLKSAWFSIDGETRVEIESAWTDIIVRASKPKDVK